jgi:hypothetical protein
MMKSNFPVVAPMHMQASPSGQRELSVEFSRDDRRPFQVRISSLEKEIEWSLRRHGELKQRTAREAARSGTANLRLSTGD